MRAIAIIAGRLFLAAFLAASPVAGQEQRQPIPDAQLLKLVARFFVVTERLAFGEQPLLTQLDDNTEQIIQSNHGGYVLYLRRSPSHPCTFGVFVDRHDFQTPVRVFDFTYLTARYYTGFDSIEFIGDGVHSTSCRRNGFCLRSIFASLPRAGQEEAADLVSDIQASGCPAVRPIKYYGN